MQATVAHINQGFCVADCICDALHCSGPRYKENNPLLASKPSTEAPAPPKRRAAPIYVEEDEDAGKPQPRTLKPGDTFGEVRAHGLLGPPSAVLGFVIWLSRS
jgi:hypothetical protein